MAKDLSELTDNSAKRPKLTLCLIRNKYLQFKNCFKHHKQWHLVFKMKSKIFFVKVQDPFHILTTVFERCYYPVKSHFSAFPPLVILQNMHICSHLRFTSLTNMSQSVRESLRFFFSIPGILIFFLRLLAGIFLSYEIQKILIRIYIKNKY